jgi:hypothetical protein
MLQREVQQLPNFLPDATKQIHAITISFAASKKRVSALHEFCIFSGEIVEYRV